jgi:hypothetical protein
MKKNNPELALIFNLILVAIHLLFMPIIIPIHAVSNKIKKHKLF